METVLRYIPLNPPVLSRTMRQRLGLSLKKDRKSESKEQIGKLKEKLSEINARLTAEIALAKADRTFVLTVAYQSQHKDNSKLQTYFNENHSSLKLNQIDAELTKLLEDYFLLSQSLYDALVTNSFDFSDEDMEREWGSALITKEQWENGKISL